jgi:CRP/FNR family cyclic AMP-dependent transcriptional regulator
LSPVRVVQAPARTRLVLEPSHLGAWVYLIEVGLLRPVAITPEGRELVLGLLGPGEALLQPGPADGPHRIGLYVEALEDTRCLAVPRAELAGLAARDPELAGRLLEALADRVADLGELAASLTLEGARERLVRLLLRLAGRHGAAEAGTVRLRLRQQDLAAMAGVCRETANAALRELQASRAVRLGRQTLWVRPDRLEVDGSLRRRGAAAPR